MGKSFSKKSKLFLWIFCEKMAILFLWIILFLYLCSLIYNYLQDVLPKVNSTTNLKEWALRPARKPLLLRGARQVGKSTAVRELGKTI